MAVLTLVKNWDGHIARAKLAQDLGLSGDDIGIEEWLPTDENLNPDPWVRWEISYKGIFLFDFVCAYCPDIDKVIMNEKQYKNLLFCFKGWLYEKN